MPTHVSITDPDIHEPKGASTASTGEVLTSLGDGTTEWVTPVADITGSVSQGIYKYSDLATQTTPLALTVADTEYELTCDGLGEDNSSAYGLTQVSDAWNTSTDRLQYSGLSLGDTGDLIAQITVTTTSTNTAITMYLEMNPSGTEPFRVALIQGTNFKSAGTYQIDAKTLFFIKDTNLLNGGARIVISADSTGATVETRGIVVRLFHTN